jgi:deoxyribodipyrimidine photolyase
MEHAPEVISALQTMAAFLEEMGIPGLLGLLLIGPCMMVIAVFALDYLRQRHIRQEDDLRRQESKADRELIRELIEKHRIETLSLVERHREETASIMRDLGEKHSEVTQYYKDNVELVKSTQRLATDMRDIIVNNTRAMERLTSAVEANFFCPVAREAATGKK